MYLMLCYVMLANVSACELSVKRVATYGVVLYRNQCPVNSIFAFNCIED